LITVIGCGRVGKTVAEHLVARQLDDVVLVDVVQNMPQGEALDIGQMAVAYDIDARVTGSNDLEAMSGSDVVVVTAGAPRGPGVSRLALLEQNSKTIAELSKKIAEFAPKAVVVVITNPLDVMTYVALRATGFDRSRVLGMGGILDVTRYRYFLARALGVSPGSVQGMIVGEHGDSMVPLHRYCTVSGVPVTELLSGAQLVEVAERTRRGGGEVIALKGGTFYGPASCATVLVEALVRDRELVAPASVYLAGEYGVDGVCIGVPVVLGRGGVKKIVELRLTEEERGLFHKSVQVLRAAISSLPPLKG
jgi:malate dehydrogenase